MSLKRNWAGDRVRLVCFVLACLVIAAVFWGPLAEVIGSSLSEERYSHILLVIPASAALLWLERKRILARKEFSLAGGLAIAGFIVAFAVLRGTGLSEDTLLSLSILLATGAFVSAFVLCHGLAAFRAGAFPLLFLLFIAPLPSAMLDRITVFLQQTSTDMVCLLFGAARIPFVRDGVVIALPRVTIEVARECSSIRSSYILFLSSLVLGQLYLKSGPQKLFLALASVPLSIAKNGLRIFTLSVLGMYLDPSFLTGRLHRDGGFLFFGVGFLGLMAFIWLIPKVKSWNSLVRREITPGHT